jgi:hypothetical protein
MTVLHRCSSASYPVATLDLPDNQVCSVYIGVVRGPPFGGLLRPRTCTSFRIRFAPQADAQPWTCYRSGVALCLIPDAYDHLWHGVSPYLVPSFLSCSIARSFVNSFLYCLHFLQGQVFACGWTSGRSNLTIGRMMMYGNLLLVGKSFLLIMLALLLLN